MIMSLVSSGGAAGRHLITETGPATAIAAVIAAETGAVKHQQEQSQEDPEQQQ